MWEMDRRWVAVIALALCAWSGVVPAAASEELTAEALDTFVTDAMETYGVPGAGVVVVDGDRRIVRTYGVREAGTEAAVDRETRFAIASLTKAWTADLAAVAVDAGALDWDEPVVAHLPAMRLANEHTTLRVTVRDLLSHAAGFPAFAGGLLNAAGYGPDEMIRRLRHFPLVAELREEANYSNPGVFLAGTATSRALGAPSWSAAMTEHLLRPLGMEHTDFASGPMPPDANAAHPHLKTSQGLVSFDEIEETRPLGPASAAVTTVEDFARWLAMRVGDGELDGRRVISEAAIAEVRRPVILEEPGMSELPPIAADTLFAYSPGWGVYSFANHTIYEKGGARGGFRAIAVDVPEADLAIGIVCNLGLTAFPEAVRAWVLERVLGEDTRGDNQAAILAAQETLDEMFGGVLDRPEADPSIEPALPLEAYVGRYESPLYGTLTIERAGAGLRWAIGPSGYGGEALPAGHDAFDLLHPSGVLALPEDVIFAVDREGRPTRLTSSSWGGFDRRPE